MKSTGRPSLRALHLQLSNGLWAEEAGTQRETRSRGWCLELLPFEAPDADGDKDHDAKADKLDSQERFRLLIHCQCARYGWGADIDTIADDVPPKNRGAAARGPGHPPRFCPDLGFGSQCDLLIAWFLFSLANTAVASSAAILPDRLQSPINHAARFRYVHSLRESGKLRQ